MDNGAVVLFILSFIVGVIVGMGLVASQDVVVVIKGTKSSYMTVDYKDKTYRLEALK